MAVVVWFSNLRTGSTSLLDKVTRLLKNAGLKRAVAPGDLVAVKLHFGETGNMAYIRPPFVRRAVDMVKDYGGRPFLTDANTLYVGTRQNSVEHMETAIRNGFDYAVVGAPLIIADGLTGKDYVKVPVPGKHFREVNIGSAAYHADAMVVMSHFKCHELTGFGGAIKNIGMGLGSRSGKQQMHSDVLPEVKDEKCTGCAKCKEWCPADAIEMQPWEGNKKGLKAYILDKKCWGCGECAVTCQFDAVRINWRTTPEAAQEKMAEYALGAVQGKTEKVVYISFVMNVSPDCDCFGHNDHPIVQDIGILASLDPVALDTACYDLVNSQPALIGSVIEGCHTGEDKFQMVHPGINPLTQLEHSEKIGLGMMQYELRQI
ncbi:MAG: DUF362 domain-containing protein [Syntrophomonadaceae bacterium]|nr:DUF362 domain-containing protein [Syntrophomonadaceae bacterium]